MKHSLESIKNRVSERRGLVALLIATRKHRDGSPATEEDLAAAHDIERRAGVLERRIRRRRDLRERDEGDVSYVELPERYSLDEAERALGIEKPLTNEDDLDDAGAAIDASAAQTLSDDTARTRPLPGHRAPKGRA